ncbi:hypothetical protein [Streptomyces longwoodensis]|uniref:hypothetical protein n=1 Tax=Streptomyces longwoodensis TaxID=68231 RepID=UPI00384C4115
MSSNWARTLPPTAAGGRLMMPPAVAVSQPVRTLLKAATVLPAAGRPAERERLRRALIDADEIQAART